MNIAWSAKARRDPLDIYGYLAPRNPAAARRMQQIIRAKVGALATTPLMGRAGRIETTRELVGSGAPAVVAYRVTPAGVQVLAVVHRARDLPGGVSVRAVTWSKGRREKIGIHYFRSLPTISPAIFARRAGRRALR